METVKSTKIQLQTYAKMSKWYKDIDFQGKSYYNDGYEIFSNAMKKGGEMMVEETIKTIKETEKEAEELIKNAAATCTEILERAAAEAKELKQKAEMDAKAKADADMKAAVETGEKSAADALKSVEAEITSLKDAVRSKEDEAVVSIISELV